MRSNCLRLIGVAILAAPLVACTGDDPSDSPGDTAATLDTDDPDDPDDTDIVDTATDTGTAATGVYATLVRGTLFTGDLGEAQTAHDGIASYGEQAATAAGDFAHDALLGTGLLYSTTPDSFLAIDRWDDDGAMAAFYADPAFGDAFGTLFSGPPTIEYFEAQPGWYNWGSMEAGDAADPYFFAVIRGRLADPDPAGAQAGHDGVAAYGEAAVTAAGDVAHIVYTGLDDPQEFLAIDIWTSDAAIVGVYSDPDFQAAFATLFEAPATLQIYRSTDWHQW